ncbi:MAG TPA: class I tRNA ligase family protein [Patescibacteria group bacterium]|jgi:leucyl-tRNA synthetase|nr:class I tRNA ligase family protein [Patescibacteria group bacterium]
MKKYNPQQIEKKWQEYWKTNKTFAASDSSDKPKKFVLMEFPYPSGDGLHMGHVRGYTAGDVVSRYYRMQGQEVMYPIGWDAFGLPAENYAIKHGKDPKDTTTTNIANIKKQFQSIGYSFDWDREINTTDPEYYKWTQWLFLKFYEAGLAYEATGLINWCPKDKTGLSNEEVINGACERCGTKVEKKELRQWYLKITEYADKLLEGLKHLPEWPEAVKLQQENWIGKKEGSEIEFYLDFKKNPAGNDRRGPDGEKAKLTVFTTRPDTIFGATFLVLAPEHLWVTLATDADHDVLENKEEVKAYVDAAKAKDEMDRTDATKEKTGVELKGVKAINPATNEEIPIWVADYVLGGYGTGAIMAVPGHDERDHEFAEKFNLSIIELTEFADGNKFGTPKTTYRLRDWVFSRQRYWGEPIPLVHCEKDGVVAVPEDQLPVVLPEVKDYEPTGTGESPLAVVDEWVNTTCPKCGGAAKRETNTMPQWAGSSWYYLRYADPHNAQAFADQEKLKHWLPVDLYFGGMEHTTLHLLYSRFWNIFLHDQGLVPVSEPYTKRIPHGIILAADGSKMSKSKGNVVNPDSIVKEFGADVLRMYELFLGPHEASVSWSDKGIIGVARFLDRVWFWVSNAKATDEDSDEVLRALHTTIKKVTEDLENYKFNTVVSSLMSLHNEIKDQSCSKASMLVFAQMLYPIAPHIAEEIAELLGSEGSLQFSTWPTADESLLGAETMKVVVQVNGKVKDTLVLPLGTSEEEIKTQAMQSERVQATLTGKEPQRVIYVEGKLLNIVI